MNRRVSWSRRALRDVKIQAEFISQDNEIAGRRVAEALRKSGSDLGKFLTGRPGRSGGLFEKSVSKLPYVLVYTIQVLGRDETVVILRVIHTSRDWPAEGWPE